MELMGYHGNYLKINLTDKTWTEESLSTDIIMDYLGGRGLGTKLLYDLQKEGIDPLSSESHLVIFSGPVTNTGIPGSSRLMFICKSPASYTISSSSMGGSFPNAFKQTGHDGIVLTGKAKEPVWLQIDPNNIIFHTANEIKGLTTSETEKILKEKLGKKYKVACIGPAGENLVKFSSIVSETRTAARGGIGAVMGSKNLKAIAVSGNINTPVKDKVALKNAIKKVIGIQKENISVVSMKQNGTAGMVSIVNTMGGLPTKNYKYGTFDHADEIDGNTVTQKNRIKGLSCVSCTVGCSLISEIKEGEYKGVQVEGPEYETEVMLGSNLMISNISDILASNYLCDEYGLDTISTGNVLGFAFEAYEKDVLTVSDTFGLELKWGDGKLVTKLIQLISERKGIGNLLAEGVARISDKFPETKSFAMHVKGLELAAYDPRAIFAQGLSYAISPRGGDHGKGGYMIADFFTDNIDLYSGDDKAFRAIELAIISAIFDNVQLCNFNFIPITVIPEILTAVIGEIYTEEILDEIALRTITLERKFNVREGFSRKDDTLPSRLTEEPLPGGMAEGKKVDILDIMLDDYYILMGFDKNGIPLNEELKAIPFIKRKKFEKQKAESIQIDEVVKKSKKKKKKSDKGQEDMLIWEKNSREMFDILVSATPRPFRSSSKRNLLQAIISRSGEKGNVTEQFLIDSVKEVTPKAFLAASLKNIEPLKSNS